MASLADAEEALRSTNSKANFQRLTRLLMRGGLRFLTETFDSIHSPADLHLTLSDPAIERQLRGAKLSRPERACLYPSPGVYGKSTDCDITLLFRLLRTICNLTPPPGPRGWDDLPNSSDHSLEADLVRIKYYRNEVYGHKKTMEISDVEFVRLWEEIRETLLRIAATISPAKRNEWETSIDKFLSDPLTPEEEICIEELERWYMNDMDVKAEVEKLDATVKEEVKEVKTLKEDMKRGHESIQDEVRRLREEVRQSPAPVYITGPVQVIQMHVVNTVESIVTQTGLPISPQLPQTVGGSERSCVVPIHPDQEQPEGYSGERQLNQQIPPDEINFWNVILSFKEPFLLFIKYLRYKLNVDVRSHDVGSLLITVECSSLQILEGLWEDYCSGHLNQIAQEVLVTADVLEKLGVTDVKLKTFISEEEYEKGKHIFNDNSEQSKVDSSAVQQRVSLTGPSIPKGSLTGEIEEDTALASSSKSASSSQDYLERISKLEKENVELRRKMEAIEQGFEGMKKAEKERLEFTRMVTPKKKNVDLEERMTFKENEVKRFSLELSQLKDELDYIREMAEEEPFYRPRHFGRMSSPTFRDRGKPGLCHIIINGQCSENLFKEEMEVRSVFQDLDFDVVKSVCSPEDDIESVIEYVAWRSVSRDYSSLVCFILSDVTESGKILNFAGKSLSGVSELMAMFSRSEIHRSIFYRIPKIFIIQGHQKLTGLETEVPPVDQKSVTVQLLARDTLCLFVPYRKGYISTLLSTIKSHGSTHDILYILSEAKKSFYEENNISIPDPVHTFSSEVYLSYK